jgi:hypothetical protein
MDLASFQGIFKKTDEPLNWRLRWLNAWARKEPYTLLVKVKASLVKNTWRGLLFSQRPRKGKLSSPQQSSNGLLGHVQ